MGPSIGFAFRPELNVPFWRQGAAYDGPVEPATSGPHTRAIPAI